ncbi:MAG: hypothetical protein KKH28_13820, partial [Elusimicrobia bacterium]|nr:hypothetical protein [Elusimicrobiota bacterium]
SGGKQPGAVPAVLYWRGSAFGGKPATQATLYEHICGLPDEDCRLDPRIDYEAVEPAPADD